MDFSRVENSWTIPGSGGRRRLDIVEAMVEVGAKEVEVEWLMLSVSTTTSRRPAEQFEVYRNGPGWKQLYAGLVGDDSHMAAAHHWWTQHRDSPLVRGYHVLLALEGYLQSPDRSLADMLGARAAEVKPGGLYSAIVDSLMDLRLLGLRPDGRFGITKQAEAVLRPTQPGTLERFGSAMTAALQQAEPTEASSRPGQAFAPMKVVAAASWSTTTAPGPTTGSTRSRGAAGR